MWGKKKEQEKKPVRQETYYSESSVKILQDAITEHGKQIKALQHRCHDLEMRHSKHDLGSGTYWYNLGILRKIFLFYSHRRKRWSCHESCCCDRRS